MVIKSFIKSISSYHVISSNDKAVEGNIKSDQENGLKATDLQFKDQWRDMVELKGSSGANKEISKEEQQDTEELKKRDAEVKAHESAHLSAAGPYAVSKANYQYQRGADGKMYAVGGEVKIDVSPEPTPEATIMKMRIVQRAALAPAKPSGQDRRVAAQAAALLAQAQQMLSREEIGGGDTEKPNTIFSLDIFA